MSKLTESESARINGAKSHGAVTPQGRRNFSMNAASHGLTVKTPILQNENQAHFLEILNAYFEYAQSPDFEKRFETYDEGRNQHLNGAPSEES
jgi:hypothetical protein